MTPRTRASHRRRSAGRSLIVGGLVVCATHVGLAAGSPGMGSPAQLGQGGLQGDPREQGLQRRAQAILETAATSTSMQDLDRWWRREGIPDPHKYVLPAMLAKLVVGNEEPESLWEYWSRLDRERPGIYHFRSLFDVRLFHTFSGSLPEAARARYAEMLTKDPSTWLAGGTENHISQTYYSGLALADGSEFESRPDVRAVQEAWLKGQLDKFLTSGQGEFLSSTYMGYTIGALLNLHDFARTDALRELARAQLDWLATQLALRLSWGTVGGVESRGFDHRTWNSGASAVAWLWWGPEDGADILRSAQGMKRSSWRLALPAALSSYRPPAILRSLARKDQTARHLLPFSLAATHPAYYPLAPTVAAAETFYATHEFTLGTLVWPERDHGRSGTINAQTTMFKLVVRGHGDQENLVVRLGGRYHSSQGTGRSPGTQFLQSDDVVLMVQRLTAEDLLQDVPEESRLVLPTSAAHAGHSSDWSVWDLGRAWLVTRAFGDRVQGPTPLDSNSDLHAQIAEGQSTAWALTVLSKEEFPSPSAITTHLAEVRLDVDLQQGRLRMTHPRRGSLDLRAGDPMAARNLDGQRWNMPDRPLLSAPFLRQENARLTIDDGTDSWTLRATPRGPQWSTSNP